MKKISIVLFVLSLCVLSCDFFEGRFLKITNKSNNEICAFITKKEIKTMIKSDIDDGLAIKPNEEAGLTSKKTFWGNYIKKCDGEKLRVYIISQDSFYKYGWDKIFKEEMYLKKYYFTMEDLEKNNFQLIYK